MTLVPSLGVGSSLRLPPIFPVEGRTSEAPPMTTNGENALERVEDAHNKLLHSGNFGAYLKKMDMIAQRSAQENLPIDWREILPDLEIIAEFLRLLPKDGRPYLLRVASAYLTLAREARWCSQHLYADYCRGADLRQCLDRDIRLAVKSSQRNRPGCADALDATRMVRRMSGQLASYKRHLAYLAGLVSLVRGDVFEMKGLVLKRTPFLERMLLWREDRSWDGLVLGDEYIHIHRAMAKQNYDCSRDKMILNFRDDYRKRGLLGIVAAPWSRTYSYPEFAAVIAFAELWEGGWILGRTMEKLELDVFLHLTSAEAECDVPWRVKDVPLNTETVLSGGDSRERRSQSWRGLAGKRDRLKTSGRLGGS